MKSRCLALGAICVSTLPLLAQAPAPLPLLGNRSTQELAEMLRGFLLNALPDPLYEASPGWGQMAYVKRGVVWKGEGGVLQPHFQYSHKNDGTWRKIRVTADRPAETLLLQIDEV